MLDKVLYTEIPRRYLWTKYLKYLPSWSLYSRLKRNDKSVKMSGGLKCYKKSETG